MDPFLGEIKLVGFNFAPQGWALCNGALLPINQYAALFSLLGTTYGGDGRTNFALPNLQSRVPIGVGTGAGLSPYTQGQMGGVEKVTLTAAQMPMHNHVVNASSNPASQPAAQGGLLPSNGTRGGANLYTTGGSVETMATNMIAPAGNSQPVATLTPYLALYYIIALQGIFPSRP